MRAMRWLRALGLALFLPCGASAIGKIGTHWPQFPQAHLGIYQLVEPCSVDGPRVAAEGSGYSAELWYGGTPGLAEQDLVVLPDSMSPLWLNGQILFGSLSVPGSFGGDRISLQLRVWENLGGTIKDWEQVLANPKAARGVSKVISDYELSGVSRDGQPILGGGSIYDVYGGGLVLTAVCPEPSGPLLIGLSLGAVTVFFRRTHRRG